MILAKTARRLAACRIKSRAFRQHSSAAAADRAGDVAGSRGRERRIIFSGIQPTGVPHLGNYLGALQSWVRLQNDSYPEDTVNETSTRQDVNYFCVVDLHALTLRQDPSTFSKWRKESFASLLAVGLDPKKSRLFFQSSVPAHSELMWLLSTFASTGYLSRMTQWKSKLDLSDGATLDDEKAKEVLKLGLFSYPVLQAADVLLYNTTHVPIGADQAQHMEFTRSVANSFNSIHGQEFRFEVPQSIISPAKRVMSLKHPTKKMSKSDPDPNSRILITDTAEEIHSKVKAAVTDSIEGISYDPTGRPGVSNLIDILKYTSGNDDQPAAIAHEYQNLSKKAFKELVADSIIASLDGIRERYEAVLSSPHQLRDAAEEGRHQARREAESTLARVHKAMGM